MCHKIRCDGEFWKVFGFWGELKKALLPWEMLRLEKKFQDAGKCSGLRKFKLDYSNISNSV